MQEAGLDALTCFAQDESARDFIRDNKGILYAVVAMQRHRSDPKVNAAAFRALAVFSNDYHNQPRCELPVACATFCALEDAVVAMINERGVCDVLCLGRCRGCHP